MSFDDAVRIKKFSEFFMILPLGACGARNIRDMRLLSGDAGQFDTNGSMFLRMWLYYLSLYLEFKHPKLYSDFEPFLHACRYYLRILLSPWQIEVTYSLKTASFFASRVHREPLYGERSTYTLWVELRNASESQATLRD